MLMLPQSTARLDELEARVKHLEKALQRLEKGRRTWMDWQKYLQKIWVWLLDTLQPAFRRFPTWEWDPTSISEDDTQNVVLGEQMQGEP